MQTEKTAPPTQVEAVERLRDLYAKIAEHERMFSHDGDTPWQWVDDASCVVHDLLALDQYGNATNAALTRKQSLIWMRYGNALKHAVRSNAPLPGPVLPAIPRVA